MTDLFDPGDEVLVDAIGGALVCRVVRDDGGPRVRVVTEWGMAKERSVPRGRLKLRNGRPRPTTGRLARPFTHAMPSELIEQPKETRWRSEAFLRHARETGREWGCPGCGTTESIEAAHNGSDGGMALKPSDCFATGQCHDCHMLTHAKEGAFPRMTPSETRAAIRERQVRTMAEWISGRRRG